MGHRLWEKMSLDIGDHLIHTTFLSFFFLSITYRLDEAGDVRLAIYYCELCFPLAGRK